MVSQYGGRPKGWVKKSSEVLVLAGRRAEIHWYEHRGVGRFEQKIRWIDR